MNKKLNSNKNLIISTISNYKWKDMAIFFKSYEKAGFKNCDFVVFVSNINGQTLNKIKSCGIIIHPIPEEYKKVPILNSRWKIYEDFIKNNLNKYNQVLICDTRDVLFQKDLFKNYNNINKSFLGIAIEDGFISQEGYNKKWILDAYGEEKFNIIKNERIICAGTVWGTADKLYEFTKTMWEILSSEWSINLNVMDQAVVNYLIYYDKKFNDCLIKSETRDGPVMTIGLTNRELLILDSDNNILNVKGEIACVVHQYDRKKDLFHLAINKYYPDLQKEIESEKNKKKIIIFIVVVLICILFLSIIHYFKNKKKNKISKDKNKGKLIFFNLL